MPETIELHVKPAFGLPYAAADVDQDGYFVRCPVCGETCRNGEGANEDEITKGAVLAYQAHFERFARADALASAVLDRLGDVAASPNVSVIGVSL